MHVKNEPDLIGFLGQFRKMSSLMKMSNLIFVIHYFSGTMVNWQRPDIVLCLNGFKNVFLGLFCKYFANHNLFVCQTAWLIMFKCQQMNRMPLTFVRKQKINLAFFRLHKFQNWLSQNKIEWHASQKHRRIWIQLH